MYVRKQFFVDGVKPIDFLSRSLQLPKFFVARLIDRKMVLCNDEPISKKGEECFGVLKIMYHSPKPTGLLPILQTKDFAVFDKPSMLLVHPNGFNDEPSLLDDIRYLFGYEANLAHRLDRQTSGLVLVAKTKASQGELKTLFAQKMVTKTYYALVKGRLEKPILIDAKIRVGKQRRGNIPSIMSEVSKDGQNARTMVYPIEYTKNTTLVKALPITGKTHQIRVHLCHIGHAILGDTLYGVSLDIANDYLDGKPLDLEKTTGASRLMLEAYSLEFMYKNTQFLITRTKNPFA